MRKVPCASSFRDTFSTVSQDLPDRPVESALTDFERWGLAALPGPRPSPRLGRVRLVPRAGSAAPSAVGPQQRSLRPATAGPHAVLPPLQPQPHTPHTHFRPAERCRADSMSPRLPAGPAASSHLPPPVLRLHRGVHGGGEGCTVWGSAAPVGGIGVPTCLSSLLGEGPRAQLREVTRRGSEGERGVKRSCWGCGEVGEEQC